MRGLFTDNLSTAMAVTPHIRPDDYDKRCLEADLVALVAYSMVVFWHSPGDSRKAKKN
jgi:hypothetical protein